MKVAADFLSRCFRSILPSTVVLSALSGGVGTLGNAAQAVAQPPSAYAAPTGTASQPNGAPPAAPQPTGAAPQTNGAQPTGAASTNGASQTVPTQKSVAARRIAALCEMKNPAIDGEPLSLEKLLYGASAPSERYRRLAAYWDLAGKRAYCNLCAECANFATVCADRVQKRSEGATVPQETAAFLNASRLVAAQRREAARVDFIRSQHAFDAAFSSAAARRAAWVRRANEAQAQADAAKVAAANVGTPTSPVLYLPTATPSADVYETRFDEMSRRRWLSNEAARLNVALPLFYEATRSRGEQAQHEWNNLNAAFNAPGTSETVLFAALDRYWAASREMLAAATRYNQAIAAYVAETVPGTLRGAALLATLNQRPSVAATTSKDGADSGNSGAAPQNAPSTARQTFADETSVASASYVAPVAAPNASPVAPTSFVEPAPKPDLTPTPGARLEPADAATPATPAEPLPPTPTEPAPQPETPTPSEPAPQPEAPPSTEPAPQPEAPPPSTEPAPTAASASDPSTFVVTGYEPRRPAPPTPPTPEQTGAADAPGAAASFVGRIVRGQAPETPETTAVDASAEATQTVQKPQTPPSGAAPQNAQPPQNAPNAPSAQTPQTANAGASRRVAETVAVLFATPKAEPSPNGGADGPLEVATTLRSALERVPVSERAAVVRAYWRLQEASARVAVESALAQTLTQAFNELNAKTSGAENAAATETARLYLAAALGAQARVAEARIVKRDAQIALIRRTRRPLGEGWPIPATLPFAGATYRLETPSTTNPTLALEGAVIPENLKTIETIGAAFGPPATLCSFDVSPASAANPLVPLATLEKKRESLLLFIELVVASNVAIAEYVASYPAGFVSVDRFVAALVGPGK